MEIIGIRYVKYTSKRTGKEVNGVELHMSYEREDTVGVCTKKEFINNPDVLPQNLTLGDKVELLYNQFGSVARVEVQ